MAQTSALSQLILHTPFVFSWITLSTRCFSAVLENSCYNCVRVHPLFRQSSSISARFAKLRLPCGPNPPPSPWQTSCEAGDHLPVSGTKRSRPLLSGRSNRRRGRECDWRTARESPEAPLGERLSWRTVCIALCGGVSTIASDEFRVTSDELKGTGRKSSDFSRQLAGGEESGEAWSGE
jgi:hypothetical protein